MAHGCIDMSEEMMRRSGEFVSVRPRRQHVEVCIALHRVSIDDFAAVAARERDRQPCLAAGRRSMDQDRGTHRLSVSSKGFQLACLRMAATTDRARGSP
jgi:hypothetical protein